MKSVVVDHYIINPNEASIYPTSDELFIIFKMATIEDDVTKQITSEVDLFRSIMQHYIIVNEFNLEAKTLMGMY